MQASPPPDAGRLNDVQFARHSVLLPFLLLVLQRVLPAPVPRRDTDIIATSRGPDMAGAIPLGPPDATGAKAA